MRGAPRRAAALLAAVLALAAGAGRAAAQDASPAAAEAVGAPVTPQMFGARCDSDGTPGHGSDDTAALQNAIDRAESTGGSLKIPGRRTMCRTTRPLRIEHHLTIDGDYCQPYVTLTANANTNGPGSWLYFDHPGIGVLVTNDRPQVAVSGAVIQNICTYRNQPPYVKSGPWAPADNGFDFVLAQDDTLLRHVMTLNPTRAVHANGRFTLDDVRGSPFLVGIESRLSADVARIKDIHFWPFGAINGPAEHYKRTHLTALLLGRVDNPDIENFFAISPRICIHLTQTKDGVANKIHAVNVDCDLVGNTGLLSEAPGATGQFQNFTTQGADPEPGADATASVNGVDINAPNNHMSFNGLRISVFGGDGLIAQHPGTWLTIDGLLVENWGIVTTSAAVEATDGATIKIGAGPLFGPNGKSRVLYGGDGTIEAAVTRKVN